jgi:hypothetical protein
MAEMISNGAQTYMTAVRDLLDHVLDSQLPAII